ncbi:MAG: phenylalanine--tRNA ligase subunit beta [Actinobacteria bacterium]|nr:MAG: phenylalanine--tRNA ligase subunit beta [Actinomycetota bacterium]
MKVLLSWLREFAPFDGDPVALGNTMSGLGMAVEDLVHVGANLDGIVVARVLDVRKHPRADRIQLVDVDAGDGNALQICCGAFNMAVGDLVPLATLGTTMADGRTIERRKLMGEWSNGMLCSARELEMVDDVDGIMILDPRFAPGAPLADALGVEHDVLYDLDLTGNRPDALSVAGVARDLAAKLGLPFAIADPVAAERGTPIAQRATVTIVDTEACGRFLARILDNVRIEPSPAHIANRLTLCGMRPINNVVDVSNYVMLELGQPNHTFDLRKLANGSNTPGIRVRRARAGERVVTLDNLERELIATDLLICDQDDRPVSIAGVMGGANTEIDDMTTSVLLEMAWFEPGAIAATARRLGLRSEASLRFERGTDYEHVELCARRFAELVAPSGFTLAPGVVDALGQLPSGAPVRVRPAKVNALLGTNLSGAHMRALLEPIGFTSTDALGNDVDAFDVVVPSFRPDTSTEADVAEEVARHYGYDRIVPTMPRAPRSGALTARQRQRRRVRHLLADLGCTEAMPMPFLAPGDLERAGLDGRGLVITNPLAAEESVLRTSLRPGLLRSVAHNQSHRLHDVSFFEIGRVYAAGAVSDALPYEHERVSVILAGRTAPAAVDILDELCRWSGTSFTLKASEPSGLHPTRSAKVYVEGEFLGEVGEIHPTVLDAYGIGGRVAWLDLDLDGLLDRAASATPTYRPVSRFPSSDIDLAFEVDDAVAVDDVEAVLRGAAGELLVDFWLFDVFRGAHVAPGRRSLAFTLRLQAADRTLTDDEVAVVRERCIDAVHAALPARLRT